LIRIAVILCLCFSIIRAQDTSAITTEYKITVTYGINIIRPDEINDNIRVSGDALGSSANIIKHIPEAAVSFSTRLTGGPQIITARIGRMYISRTHNVSIPETTTSPDITGYTSGTIEEIYTFYPLSAGIGWASKSFGSQLQIEFVYALGYIDEDQSYISSAGARTAYSRTLSSPAYGFRLAGNTTVAFSERIGLTFEASYRYIVFDDYSDERTGKGKKIEFSAYGLGGAVGLSILF